MIYILQGVYLLFVHMNVLDLLSNAVKHRISQIESEYKLIKNQVMTMAHLKSVKQNEIDLLILKEQIFSILHRMYVLYLDELGKVYLKVCPMKTAVSCHIFVMSKFPLSSFLDEISGHQFAIKDLIGLDLQNYGTTIENLFKVLSYQFPYDIIFPLFASDSSFITKILKIVIQFNFF